ncbi:hypothetical protein NAE50_002637 [Salmonella enterica]|nr:hypothetical protein [Salmonella enterica]ELX2839970.1 hypothetical protein [Salmonella enterica]
MYGWQIFDEYGNVKYDHSVIMSHWIGSYDIPFVYPPGWSHTISGIPFSGGTPYAFCVPDSRLTVPPGYVCASTTPEIQLGADNITLSYDISHFSYPDDLGAPLCIGGLVLHYGVYNA